LYVFKFLLLLSHFHPSNFFLSRESEKSCVRAHRSEHWCILTRAKLSRKTSAALLPVRHQLAPSGANRSTSIKVLSPLSEILDPYKQDPKHVLRRKGSVIYLACSRQKEGLATHDACFARFTGRLPSALDAILILGAGIVCYSVCYLSALRQLSIPASTAGGGFPTDDFSPHLLVDRQDGTA
jgi:hypothetical protein